MRVIADRRARILAIAARLPPAPIDALVSFTHAALVTAGTPLPRSIVRAVLIDDGTPAALARMRHDTTTRGDARERAAPPVTAAANAR